ncbi:MAG TPA: HlyD family efflux transporter periplasmic adaptor subunit [Rhodocyclaceae bacterium]|nr:HlyD family efflux transporter periplasmic adaptor subunit [Rhodocyclaceae bacterium]
MKNLVTLLLGAVAMVTALQVHAHGDDEHDAPAAPVNANAPQRLPNGNVFLPKAAQRQMDLRTVPTVATDSPRALELNAHVVMDPNTGGKVQAIIPGRVTAGPNGLPVPGQAVKRGEVLAYVIPAVGGGSRSLAVSRLQRMRELADTVPRKSIEEAEAAVANEQMVSPVSGVIAAAYVVSGQVVDARETLFDVVDPAHVMVEALAYDIDVASNIASAYVAMGNEKLPLKFLGSARSLREQALPVNFRAEGDLAKRLAVGQALKVVVQTRQRIRGVPVPAAALMKTASNQTVVWVKAGAEMFTPRIVTVEPLDGANVTITSGLTGGERIVVQAAALLNQVR